MIQDSFYSQRLLAIILLTSLFLFVNTRLRAQNQEAEFDSTHYLTEEISLVQSKGKWALIYKDGTAAFREVFNSIKIYTYYHHQDGKNHSLLAVKNERGDVGMLDQQANIIVPILYDSIFQEGLVIYGRIGGKWSLFNLLGRDAFPVKLDAIYPKKTQNFKGHLLQKGNFYGLMDNYLNVYFEPIYDSIIVWENYPYLDYVQASINGKWGLFSIEGTKLHQILSHRYTDFSLHSWTGKYYSREHYLQIGKDGKYGLWFSAVDSIVLPVEYERMVQYYRKDNHVVLEINKGGKVGLFDVKDRQIILPTAYDAIRHNNPYRRLLTIEKDNKIGLFSLVNNQEMLPVNYDSINSKGAGELIVLKQGQKYGFYHPTTKLNTGCVYEQVIPYEDEGAYFVIKDQKIGLLDREGTEIFPCIYESIGDLSPEFIVAKLDGKSGVIHTDHYTFIDLSSYDEAQLDKYYIFVRKDQKWGLLGIDGKLQIELLYDQINWTKGKSFIAQKEGKFGVIDHYNKTIVSFTYDDLAATSAHDSWLVKKKDKFGIIDMNEVVLVDFQYTKLSDFYYQEQKYAIAARKSKYGLIDFESNTLIDFKYHDIAPFTDDKGRIAFIVKKGKYLGLMNLKGESILPLKFKTLEITEAHLIRTIDKKGLEIYYTLEGKQTEPEKR